MGFFDFLFRRGERCQSCNKKMLSAHGFQEGKSYTYMGGAGAAEDIAEMMRSAPKRPYQCTACEATVCGACAGLAARKSASGSNTKCLNPFRISLN